MIPWLAKGLNFAQAPKLEFENGSPEKRKKFSQKYGNQTLHSNINPIYGIMQFAGHGA